MREQRSAKGLIAENQEQRTDSDRPKNGQREKPGEKSNRPMITAVNWSQSVFMANYPTAREVWAPNLAYPLNITRIQIVFKPLVGALHIWRVSGPPGSKKNNLSPAAMMT